MKINVVIEVPDNWESRLDMQPFIEQEIKADRWCWNYISEEERELILQKQVLEREEFRELVKEAKLVKYVTRMEKEIDNLRNVGQAADELMATIGAEGEIDTRHPKTHILLDALYAWRPKFEEVSNVELSGAASSRPTRTLG